jgi:hypothetical protein
LSRQRSAGLSIVAPLEMEAEGVVVPLAERQAVPPTLADQWPSARNGRAWPPTWCQRCQEDTHSCDCTVGRIARYLEELFPSGREAPMLDLWQGHFGTPCARSEKVTRVIERQETCTREPSGRLVPVRAGF